MELRSCPIFLLFSSCLFYNLLLVIGIDTRLTLPYYQRPCPVLLPVVLSLSCVWRDIARSEASRATPPPYYLLPACFFHPVYSLNPCSIFNTCSALINLRTCLNVSLPFLMNLKCSASIGNWFLQQHTTSPDVPWLCICRGMVFR